MEEIRLQKYIAECGIASRRKAEELISQGNIKVINDSLIIRNLSSLDIKTYKRCLNSAIQHQVKLDAD